MQKNFLVGNTKRAKFIPCFNKEAFKIAIVKIST